jgi:hypothetical protein
MFFDFNNPSDVTLVSYIIPLEYPSLKITFQIVEPVGTILKSHPF